MLNASGRLLVAFALPLACIPALAQSSGSQVQAGNFERSYTAGVRAFQADSFTDSIGYATHVSYNDANNYYQNLPAITALLQASGIRHIRDGWANDYNASSFEVAGYNSLIAAGMKLTLLMANQPTEAGLNAFQTYVHGGVEAWEGFNECDGSSTVTCATAVSWLPAELASAKDLGIPSLGLSNAGGNLPTQTGNIQALITAQNLHAYRDNSQNPEEPSASNLNNGYGYGYASLSWWMTNSRLNAINLPFYVTETGYTASPTAPTGELTEATQGKYLIRTLLWDFMFGIKRTYLYEFFDEGSSPDYGVIHNDLTPKAAYTYIKTVALLLADKGPAFLPAKLVYTLTGGDATLHQLLFQKRSGSFFLVLWLGQPAGAVVTQNLSLTLTSGSITSVSTFSDLGVMTTTAASGKTATLPVTDHLTIVQVN